METNIKGLPEGNYFTRHMYSDTQAWREVCRTAKTVTVQRVEVEYDPEWVDKRQFHPGGFFGHVSNQREQTWLYLGLGEKRVLRATNCGWSHKGERFTEGRAWNFYDYNF